jgi:hypothetical protein
MVSTEKLENKSVWFVAEWELQEMCVFLALSCHRAFCDGLHRCGGTGLPSMPEGCRNRSVCQDLHEMQDKSVADQITTAIKSAVHEKLKFYYSAKSLRCGVMIHLAWDPAVTYEESVALGGWTTPSNSDCHMWVHLVSIILVILSVAGYLIHTFSHNCQGLAQCFTQVILNVASQLTNFRCL